MIELERVTVAYHDVTALIDVSLSIDRGEFAFLVGPTGAGKSTLLKLLYVEQTPTRGRVSVNGRDLSKIRRREIPPLRRTIGVVFQDFSLLPDRNAYENVAFALRVTGAGRTEVRRQVPHVLELVGMASRPDAFPHELSGGEQQRVAIARALVHEPPILLADEPTGNLDPNTSLGIILLLNQINLRGTTVLVATHDAAIVDTMQWRVIAFELGRVIRDQTRGAYYPYRTDLEDVASCASRVSPSSSASVWSTSGVMD